MNCFAALDGGQFVGAPFSCTAVLLRWRVWLAQTTVLAYHSNTHVWTSGSYLGSYTVHHARHLEHRVVPAAPGVAIGPPWQRVRARVLAAISSVQARRRLPGRPPAAERR